MPIWRFPPKAARCASKYRPITNFCMAILCHQAAWGLMVNRPRCQRIAAAAGEYDSSMKPDSTAHSEDFLKRHTADILYRVKTPITFLLPRNQIATTSTRSTTTG